MKAKTQTNSPRRPIPHAGRRTRIVSLAIGFPLAVCLIPFALAQRNATTQSVAKFDSASKGLAGIDNSLPATVIVVTNTNDSGPGSLRDALAIANDGDTIDATGVSGTILLTSGELQINHNVTINGPGAGNLVINGNATFRVFENFASNVTVSGFTITNGFTNDTEFGGSGILNHGGLTVGDSSIVSNAASSYGGGISSSGGEALTVTNSLISDNSSGINGGGIAICCGEALTVTNSVISDNSSGDGGGIHAVGPGTIVTVSNSTINHNVAVSFGLGGGIFSGNNGQLTVANSIISGNVASSGGGILSGGGATLTVTASVISGNVASGGGGIEADSGTATVSNSTISDNHADSPKDAGGGILNGGNLTVTNSTISDNTAANPGGAIYNCSTANIGDTVLNAGASGGTISNGGTFTSLGYNLASDNGGGVLTGPGDQINTDPMLGPLQDNGGPTLTHALLPGSPAIDAGDPNFTPPPSYDQRGAPFHRVFNSHIDIGSFEVQAPRVSPTPRPRLTPPPRP